MGLIWENISYVSVANYVHGPLTVWEAMALNTHIKFFIYRTDNEDVTKATCSRFRHNFGTGLSAPESKHKAMHE